MGDDDLKDVPRVVYDPGVKEDIEKDPALKKAVTGLNECIMNAMQGVKDGRYKTFEDAMEAIAGQRPVLVVPRYQPLHGYYLGFHENPKAPGTNIALIMDGNPLEGHSPVRLLDVCFDCKTLAEAQGWMQRQVILEPWADGPDDEDKTVTKQ